MTRFCCPGCRLRFTQETAAKLMKCPFCGGAIESAGTVGDLLGYRLFNVDRAQAPRDLLALRSALSAIERPHDGPSPQA